MGLAHDKKGTSTNVHVTTGFQRHKISNHTICDSTWFLIMTEKKRLQTIKNQEVFWIITGTLVDADLDYDVMNIFIH